MSVDMDSRELPIFVDNYKFEYFDKTNQLNAIRIKPEWKEKIDEYGSLSKYLDFENQKIENEDKKQKEIESLNRRIGELTIKNLELQNRKFKREIIFGIIGFIIATIITNWKDILILLKVLPPE